MTAGFETVQYAVAYTSSEDPEFSALAGCQAVLDKHQLGGSARSRVLFYLAERAGDKSLQPAAAQKEQAP